MKCLAHSKRSVDVIAYYCLFLWTWLMCKCLEDRDCVWFVFESLVPSTGPGGGRWVLMMLTVSNGDA